MSSPRPAGELHDLSDARLEGVQYVYPGAWPKGVWNVAPWRVARRRANVLICAWAEGTCGRLSRSRGPKAVVCLQYVACSPQRAARRCVACFPMRGPKECGMLSLARDPEACGMVTPARGPEACDVFSSAMWPEGLRYVFLCARPKGARNVVFSARGPKVCHRVSRALGLNTRAT